MIKKIINSLQIMLPHWSRNISKKPLLNYCQQYYPQNSISLFSMMPKNNLLSDKILNNLSHKSLSINQIFNQQLRTVTKYSWKRGSRKSVSVVTQKFFRLHWGIWIRTMAGRHKKLWKKSGSQKNKLQYHVFCNLTQSRMLDKMVTKYWKKPKYYLEDPYDIYHTREEFPQTRTKPYRPEE